MAYQPEDFIIDLQLFAEEGVEPEEIPADDFDLFDNLNDGDPFADDGENSAEPEATPTEGDEEFIEITYNKETVKIPKSEQQTYLQKGYNYDKVHGRLTETETALRARDLEVSRRFGEQGIHTWDDLVKGWDNAQQAQYDQQIQTFDQQTTLTLQRMEQDGYDMYQLQMYADQRTLMKQNMELTNRLANSSKQQNNKQSANQVETLKKQIISDHEALKKEYGDLVPALDQLDEETKNDMFAGMPLRKAFIANNHAAILKYQQEATEKRTVANISDRVKKGTETKPDGNVAENKLTSRQKELAKIFGVPVSEVAKRI